MRAKICLVITSLLLAVVSIHAQSIWDGKHLERVKQSLHQPYFSAAYQELISGADRLLDVRPLSVMLKEKTPGSGDKHDYMSQARYYWPDPPNLTACLTSAMTASRTPNWTSWIATASEKQLSV